MLKVKDKDFEKVLRQRGQTAVVFIRSDELASAMEPILEKQEDEADVHIAAAVIDPQSHLARQYRIGTGPTMILFENGRAQRRLDADPTGRLTEEAMRRFLR
jgi:thioredoxin-like negative regulator of GroEL